MKRPAFLILLIIAFLAPAAAAQDSQARSLAREANEIIRSHPFEGEYLEAAAQKIKQASELDPNEPWVYIAASRLVARMGYVAGDPYKAKSYEPGALEQAATLAEKAVALGPQVSEAHVRLASIYTTMRKMPEAKGELYTAHQLDPDAFLPWYEQAVWYWYSGDAKKCEAALAGAEARAKNDVDRRALGWTRIDIAQSRGNTAEEERLHRELIAREPKNAWLHGNFAGFLMRVQRYDEAVAEYQKAVALAPYGIAVEQLEEARKLRDQQRKKSGS